VFQTRACRFEPDFCFLQKMQAYEPNLPCVCARVSILKDNSNCRPLYCVVHSLPVKLTVAQLVKTSLSVMGNILSQLNTPYVCMICPNVFLLPRLGLQCTFRMNLSSYISIYARVLVSLMPKADVTTSYEESAQRNE